jgi:hypothetical protein
MHAALVNVTIDPDQAPAAANALTHDILPAIRSAPGFLAGYWLEPVDGHGFSFVVFETEEQARRSAPPASNWAAPGVGIKRGRRPASGCQRLEVVSERRDPPADDEARRHPSSSWLGCR